MKINGDPSSMVQQTLQKSLDTERVDKKNPEELRKLCGEFESMLIKNMFKEMRATIPESGLLERGMAEEVFEDMMDTEAAKQMAQKDSLGLGEVLCRQLLKDES